MSQDPYEILGVPRGADFCTVVKPAYRKLAKDLHPDVKPGDKEAETRFKEVSAAFKELDHQFRDRKNEADVPFTPWLMPLGLVLQYVDAVTPDDYRAVSRQMEQIVANSAELTRLGFSTGMKMVALPTCMMFSLLGAWTGSTMPRTQPPAPAPRALSSS